MFIKLINLSNMKDRLAAKFRNERFLIQWEFTIVFFVCRSPEQLKKRIGDEDLEAMKLAEEEKLDKIKIDEETTGVTEHKGSKWESSWKNFKEQNPFVQSRIIHIDLNFLIML